MKKTIRKITILLLIAFILIPTVSVGFSSFYIAKGAYALTNNDYDNTNILEDLSELNLDEYKADKTKDLRLLTFVEYAYPYYSDMKDHYALYVYIYNPKQLNIDVNSRAHRIQLSTVKTAEGTLSYEKFEIKFLSKSEAPRLNLFYKFKVVDRNISGTYFYDRVNKQSRQYDIASIELKEYAKDIIRDVTRKKFFISGYSKGYGQNPETMTMQIKEDQLDVIDIKDLKHIFYRAGLSDKGAGYQNEINTVYFTIDDKYINEYGNLQKIYCNWYEYKTNDIIVTTNDDLFNNLNPYLGKDIGSGNKDLKYSLYNNYSSFVDRTATWSYNDNSITIWGKPKTIFYSAFKVNSLDDNISANTLKTYFEGYNKTFNKGVLDIPNRNISADLFSDEIEPNRKRGENKKTFDADDKFNLLSYDSNHSEWDKFLDYFWGKNKVNSNEGYIDVKPILQIKEKDLTTDFFSNSLMYENDLENFKSFVKENNQNKTTIVFRYSANDYYSEKVEIQEPGHLFVTKNEAFLARQSIFYNFEIITLTFKKGNEYKTIPVSMTPIDIYNTLTKPLDPEDFNFIDWVKEQWEKIKKAFGDITKLVQTIFLLAIIFIIIYLIAKLIGFISNQIYKNQKKDRK